MLLSAVSVLVVAQPIFEIPDGLMNNSVYLLIANISSQTFLGAKRGWRYIEAQLYSETNTTVCNKTGNYNFVESRICSNGNAALLKSNAIVLLESHSVRLSQDTENR
jgi:hypothetical protein